MVYDGMKYKSNDGGAVEQEIRERISFSTYQQHADEHERWLLAQLRLDTRKAPHHAPDEL